MNLENELRKALQRRDPSPGFAARVVARAESPVRQMPPARWRAAWAVGIAAMLAVGLMVNAQYRQMRAERAAQEAVIALQMVSEKLNFARGKVLRLSERAAQEN